MAFSSLREARLEPPVSSFPQITWRAAEVIGNYIIEKEVISLKR